jgi:N-ethylmaleimide reductase
MSKESLFSPLPLGALQLPNRIIMAPLTLMRAGANSMPTPLNAKYYAQRASAGLIISEGTAVSDDAHGYPNAPGIYTAEQIAGWRAVTDAVHVRGGRIIMQIAHNGRNSHSSLRPDGSVPVAPSAIVGNIPALTRDFQQVKAEIPRALEPAEIPVIVGRFRQAALNAIEAGFDGVGLQGPNSHLIEQFLENGTNTRNDNYGGSIENRCRFLLDVVSAVSAAIGADRLGEANYPLNAFERSTFYGGAEHGYTDYKTFGVAA